MAETHDAHGQDAAAVAPAESEQQARIATEHDTAPNEGAQESAATGAADGVPVAPHAAATVREPADDLDEPDGAGDDGAGDEPDGEDDEGDEGDERYTEERVVVVRRGVFIALAAVAAVAIVALAGLNVFQALRPAPAVASVNGAKISRADYDKAVAHGDGSQILDGLVTNKLIEQDAAKHHVTVTTDDVDNDLKTVKAQFPTDAAYRQALDAQHLTEPDLRDRLRIQLLVDKLVPASGTVSDSDIQTAYDAGKDTTYQGKTLDQVKDQIKTQLLQQQQSDAQSAYVDQLHSSAKISTHIPGG